MRHFHFWKKTCFLLLFSILFYSMLQGVDTASATSRETTHSSSLELRQGGAIIGRAISDAGKLAQAVAGKQRTDNTAQVVSVVATGYTAGYESTGKYPNHPSYGITYSGVKVRRDKSAISTIAADLNIFPLGTILYIPGYGYGVVADKGAAIKGKKLDLYFSTTKQVFSEWGKKKVEVRVVRRGAGKLTEQMLNKYGKAIEVNGNLSDLIWDERI